LQCECRNSIRYSRQLLLPEIGKTGKEKLSKARVLVVGAGGLGSPAVLYLAAAGVGVLGICDGDTVELSNLNRQILHGTHSLGQNKTESAKSTLANLNPDIQIITYPLFLTDENIQGIIAGWDFVLDCTDSFASKFMVNDACVKAQIPFCHAGVQGFGGQLMAWRPNIGAPCFRCVFKQPPSGVDGGKGIVGAAAGVIGCLQAMEAIKYITGAGEPLTGALLVYDGLAGEFLKVKLPPATPPCHCVTSPL